MSRATTFSAAIRLCGLSHSEAAGFLGVRLDTVKSWSAGRNRVPIGVWQMLADLWRRIEEAADGHAGMNDAIVSPRAPGSKAADDSGCLPGGADAAAGALALLIHLVDDAAIADCTTL